MLELLGLHFPSPLARLAAWIWGWVGLAYGFAVLAVIAATFGRDVLQRQFLGWIPLGLAAVLTFWDCGSVVNHQLNHESTQQVALGLDNLRAADFGNYGEGFMGYPRRQYTIAALPAAVMGRTVLALKLGFAVPFFLGVLLFYTGLRAASANPNAFAAALGAALVFCFPLVIDWARVYEESILPIAFTLQATGWWRLGYARRISPPVVALGLAWLGGTLAMGYTPGLAAVARMIVLLAGGAWPRVWRSALPPNRVLALGLIFYLLVLAGIGIWLQWKNRFELNGAMAVPGLQVWHERLVSFVILLMVGVPGGAVMPRLLALAFAIFLMASSLGTFGRTTRVIGVWAIATTFAALAMRGYFQRPPAFDLHRAMLVAPPVCAAAALWIERLRSCQTNLGDGWRGFLGVGAVIGALLAAAATSSWVQTSNETPRPLPVRPMEALIVDSLDFLHVHGVPADTSFELMAPLEVVPYHAPDYFLYFLPNVKYRRVVPGPTELVPPATFRLTYRRLRDDDPIPQVSSEALTSVMRLMIANEGVEILRTAEGNIPAARRATGAK